MAVVWGEPPSALDRWVEIAAELRARPGEWAQVADAGPNPRAFVTHINRARYQAFAPAGSFEAKSARGELWVRYVGHLKS